MTAPSHAPSLKQLLELAWPIVVSRSSQVVVGFTDAAMVASLGESSLAAATAGAVNLFNLLILPMGVVFIVSSFSSQLYGSGDFAGARRYGGYGLIVAAMAQLLCTAAAFFVPSVVQHLDYAPDVRSQMESYIAVRLYAGGAAVGLEALGNYYGGLGKTRLPMAAQVLAMVLNVALNWVFIFGHLGMPAMGVKGAALASALSTAIAFLALLGAFTAGFGAPGGPILKTLRAAELGRMLRFGLPSGLNWFFEFAAYSFFVNVVLTGLGTTSLAAFMAVMQLNHISFMPAFGLASAGAILAGQALGAKRHDDVPTTVKLTAGAAIAWQGFVGVLYLLVPSLLMRPFVQPGPEGEALLHIGVRMLMLSSAWQIFDAIANTLAETLRAAGDTAFCLWSRLLMAWLLFVPGAIVSVRYLGGGDVAAMLCFVAYIALLALVLGLRFRSGVWRTLDLAGPKPPA
jgi:MATE family multidrug resistance protein